MENCRLLCNALCALPQVGKADEGFGKFVAVLEAHPILLSCIGTDYTYSIKPPAPVYDGTPHKNTATCPERQHDSFVMGVSLRDAFHAELERSRFEALATASMNSAEPAGTIISHSCML